MLSDKMLEMLNDQIGFEFYSSNIYLQMSSWCTSQGLDGCAGFFRMHSQEELLHMFKIFDYVNDHGAMAIIPALKKPQDEYDSIAHIFDDALDHEHEVTRRINDLVAVTFEEKDFATFNFLQWFVAEQREEETLFVRILDVVKITGGEGRGLYFLDREIEKIAAGEVAAPPAE